MHLPYLDNKTRHIGPTRKRITINDQRPTLSNHIHNKAIKPFLYKN